MLTSSKNLRRTKGRSKGRTKGRSKGRSKGRTKGRSKGRSKGRTLRKKTLLRNFKGGFFNPLTIPQSFIESTRAYIKDTLVKTLLTNQPVKIQQSIKNSTEYRFFDREIDMFLDRTENLVQKTIQTSVTTGIKIVTAPFPFIGQLITTTINWNVIFVKTALRGYDYYSAYTKMQKMIEEHGGVMSGSLNDFKKNILAKGNKDIETIKEAVESVADDTVISRSLNNSEKNILPEGNKDIETIKEKDESVEDDTVISRSLNNSEKNILPEGKKKVVESLKNDFKKNISKGKKMVVESLKDEIKGVANDAMKQAKKKVVETIKESAESVANDAMKQAKKRLFKH